MSQLQKLSRRDFMAKLGLYGGGLIVLAGCGSDSTAPNSNQSDGFCEDSSPSASIAANHGHSLSVPLADLESQSSKTYSIEGVADHDHTVTITASQFQSLLEGESLQLSSSSGSGHSHSITVSCA